MVKNEFNLIDNNSCEIKNNDISYNVINHTILVACMVAFTVRVKES